MLWTEMMSSQSSTSGGKTDYFLGFHLGLVHILNNSTLRPLLKHTFPDNPLNIIVLPIKNLEEEMVCTSWVLFVSSNVLQHARFSSHGIHCVIINEDTLALARNTTPPRNLWLEASQDSNSFIFVSLEPLDSIRFNSLLRKKTLEKRWTMFGLDELHLLNDWADFRTAVSQIGLSRAPIPSQF
jgi:hypothetical protein